MLIIGTESCQSPHKHFI